MALNLITRQEYKTYASIKSSNYDTEIDELIPRVSQLVKSYCKRSFVDYMDTPKVDTLSGDCSILILQESPVVSVISVEASDDYGQSYYSLSKFIDWIDDGDYILPLNASSYWYKKLRGYRVTYTAGYVDVPDDISLAVMDLVTYYRKNDNAVHSNKAPSINGTNVEYITNANFPAHIKRVLDMYISNYA